MDSEFHEAIAIELATSLLADSQIPMGESLPKLRAAVAQEEAALPPTPTECEVLVTGGEDGEVPDYLKEKFPHIDIALNEFF